MALQKFKRNRYASMIEFQLTHGSIKDFVFLFDRIRYLMNNEFDEIQQCSPNEIRCRA